MVKNIKINNYVEYQKHYNKLIDRARNRLLEGYTENHHIIPRCMNGTDDIENIVTLTAEEHYIAHQLLVKIYPNEPKLVFAVHMMTIGAPNQSRNNKLYGWLRRKISEVHKRRIPWNKGKKGLQIAWNKGLKTGPLSEECKLKKSNLMKGKPWSLERRDAQNKRKVSNINKGKPWSVVRRTVYEAGKK